MCNARLFLQRGRGESLSLLTTTTTIRPTLQKCRTKTDFLQVSGEIDGTLEFVDDYSARTTDCDDVRLIVFQLSRRARTLAHTNTNAVVSSTSSVMTR